MCIVYSTLYPTLYTVHCTLYNVCCTFTTTHCTMYTLQCTLHRVHFVLFYVVLSDGNFYCASIPYSLQQFPLYIVQCTVYSVHFFRIVKKSLVLVERQNKSHKYHRPSIVYIVQCTVYSVQCTVYCVQCTVAPCTVQHAVLSVYCAVCSDQCSVLSVVTCIRVLPWTAQYCTTTEQARTAQQHCSTASLLQQLCQQQPAFVDRPLPVLDPPVRL